jgi:hypothetical protein
MGSEWILGRLRVEWIRVVHDSDRWLVLVKTMMNLGFWRHRLTT